MEQDNTDKGFGLDEAERMRFFVVMGDSKYDTLVLDSLRREFSYKYGGYTEKSPSNGGWIQRKTIEYIDRNGEEQTKDVMYLEEGIVEDDVIIIETTASKGDPNSDYPIDRAHASDVASAVKEILGEDSVLFDVTPTEVQFIADFNLVQIEDRSDYITKMIQQLESDKKKVEIRESIERTFTQKLGEDMERMFDDDKEVITPEKRTDL